MSRGRSAVRPPRRRRCGGAARSWRRCPWLVFPRRRSVCRARASCRACAPRLRSRRRRQSSGRMRAGSIGRRVSARPGSRAPAFDRPTRASPRIPRRRCRICAWPGDASTRRAFRAALELSPRNRLRRRPTRPAASRGCTRKCRAARYTSSLGYRSCDTSRPRGALSRQLRAFGHFPRARRGDEWTERYFRGFHPSRRDSANARVTRSRHGSHRPIHHLLRQGHRQRPGHLHRCARRRRPPHGRRPRSRIVNLATLARRLPFADATRVSASPTSQVACSPRGCSRRRLESGSRTRATRYAPESTRVGPARRDSPRPRPTDARDFVLRFVSQSTLSRNVRCSRSSRRTTKRSRTRPRNGWRSWPRNSARRTGPRLITSSRTCS